MSLALQQKGEFIDGSNIIGRTVTDVLRVSPNGTGVDGRSWYTAHTTIPSALDAASTDTNDCTLIIISPNASGYDINTTGDPTWTGNYILQGTHRTWFEIKNDHAGATSVLKFTGLIALYNLCVNLGTGNNGVIITKSNFRIGQCLFSGADLTSAKTALHLDGATTLKLGKLDDVEFLGEGTTHMTALLIDNAANNRFDDLRFDLCKTCIQVIHADSDENHFHHLHIGDSGIGLDLDAGNEQHFDDVTFHHNTTDVDDEVGDHIWTNILSETDITIFPDDFTGVSLAAAGGADTWGSDTEIRSAATATAPFQVLGIHIEADASEKFRIRLSHDSGSTYFDDIQIEGVANQQKRESIASHGSKHIFNKGVRISGSIKSESGGNNAIIWVETQVL